MRSPTAPVAVLLGLLVAARSHADVGPVGPEFQVNTYTTGEQVRPRVGADAAGNFVVVWDAFRYYGREAGPDGSESGIGARRFDAAGNPQGPEFVVNTYTLGPQVGADVSVAPSGEFVVTWQGGDYYSHQDGSESGAFVQRFAASGASLGNELTANTTTADPQIGPAVAMGPVGGALAVWESFASAVAGGDGDQSGVFARRYDASGMPVGPEFQVNTYTTGRQGDPAVAADPAGGFVVVWRSGSSYNYGGGQDGSTGGVFGQRLDAAGARIGGEFQVNTYTSGVQGAPAVVAGPASGFVVVWQSGVNYGAGGQDGSNTGVFGQRFDGAGARAGGEFQVNTYTTGPQHQPGISADEDGDLVVTWSSGRFGLTQDGSEGGVFARHLTSTGQPVGPEVQVNTHTLGPQEHPSVSADGLGNFVVVWESGDAGGGPSQDGDGAGIFGQRLRISGFEPPRPRAGAKLVLRDNPANPRGRRLTVRSDDDALEIGLGAGSRDDPTQSGGSLRVRSAAFDVTYPLPAAFWRSQLSAGAVAGWSYRDSALLAGPITKVVLKRGTLRLSGKGSGLGHDLGVNPDPVEVVLQIGASGLRQCVRLGGATAFKPDRRFRAADAAAPPSCAP